MLGKESGETAAMTTNEGLTDQPPSLELVDIRTLLRKLLRWWWLIAFCTLAGAAYGLKNAHNFVPQHTAKMIVAPIVKEGSGGGGGGSQTAQLVASFTGIALSSANATTDFERALFTLKTIAFARRLDEKHAFMRLIYASAWDESRGEWRKPIDTSDTWRGKLRKYLHQPKPTTPSHEDLKNYLGGSIEVTEVSGTPFMQLELLHSDPEMAFYLLNTIFTESLEFVHEDQIRDLESRKSYVEERLRSTTISDFRHALLNLMGDQAREEMLLYGDRPSVARIIEQPYVSKHLTAPNIVQSWSFPAAFSFIGIVGLISMVILFRSD
jgi:hypothetical protein